MLAVISYIGFLVLFTGIAAGLLFGLRAVKLL
ncbi:MAG: cytochrome b6-f complex subunit PetL [Richelia sp. RM2_1_2]|nr:cytochrome b6-f complex subunit PetL [Rivularia sp. T60_A2020_040]MEB3218820.1 cytochrome b6-f complex subunit PetL [Nostocales cyanobacterium 94392]NJL81035.1 cytochrome b6-f complex subunit PetL [Richelia sp. SM2_1_7]NJM18611.1 cytochrome b6-f complex subunit PetL [Richelia sp. SM1_7_0]NJN07930.1 cytochrome b6-f complex subunit PetL [Richelia sp. RM1_1_1]NJO26705.1 cytochrome b6-f complex subunit PetL [Richelia sp. SL_2_1]NJO57081.1 cytochrome b6-f complex subunit PetL [Richelia sp. RM2_